MLTCSLHVQKLSTSLVENARHTYGSYCAVRAFSRNRLPEDPFSAQRTREEVYLLVLVGIIVPQRIIYYKQTYTDTRDIVYNAASCFLFLDSTTRLVWSTSMVALINNKIPQGTSWSESPHDCIRVPAYLSLLSHGKRRREVSVLHLLEFIPSISHKLPVQTVDMLIAICFFISGAMDLLMHRKFLLRGSLHRRILYRSKHLHPVLPRCACSF